jgi:hypothetical protein
MLVAVLGVILRYKIAFSLPFIDQQNLLHGHSHFAFGGWVTQALMTLLVGYLSERSGKNQFKPYRWILYFNAFTAYGMLFSFPVQGYGFVSILFSTLSLFASYFFAWFFWRDLNRLPKRSVSDHWFKLALTGNVISSAGPFYLAYMMATGNIHQSSYLASIYLYLHFQYNCWFFFSCMGLLSWKLQHDIMPVYALKRVYYCFAFAVIPTYFLSLLWAQIPLWLYAMVVVGAAVQLYGWTVLLTYIRTHFSVLRRKYSFFSRVLFLLSGLAVTIKLLLQTASVIPSVSKLAFGFRPIIIGYLHLILLGIITLFIVAYVFTFGLAPNSRTVKRGIQVFVAGILINEVILMIQGVSDIMNTGIPHVTILLFVAAIILFTGACIIVTGFLFYKDDLGHKKLHGSERILEKNIYGKYSSAIYRIIGA